jgi:hypothetical protein
MVERARMHPELSDALSFEERLVLDSFLVGQLSAGRLYGRLAACGAQAPAVEDSRIAGRRCAPRGRVRSTFRRAELASRPAGR